MSEPISRVAAVAPPPHDGINELKQNFVPDFISGFIVFLIALPLSVGIALASGAPPTAGILAAIVGGVAGSLIGGSFLTINGPAAGLIVIILGAVQDLGAGDPMTGFRRMLAAAVIAGVLQIAFSILRLGALGTGVPGSVIHGMLTAIGVVIMAKQFHVALGVIPQHKDVLGLIAEIPASIEKINPEVALIAAVGFMIILAMNQMKGTWAKYVPAPLLVVITGYGLGHLFDFDHVHLAQSHWLTFEVGPKLLLNLPENLAKAIIFPDFSAALSPASLRWAISLALVASIESLLSAAAVDKMDPYHRVSNLDSELLGKGICNIICGCIGGLPIIAEMVRSSANVRYGARTRWANFFHGLFIFAFLILFPRLLHDIPLAAFAAILISVGYRLAHPVQFLHTAAIGKDHFAAFVTTLVVTLASDLLIGVVTGLVVEVAFNLFHGASLSQLFKVSAEEQRNGDKVQLTISSALVFTNFPSLQRKLNQNGSASELVLDLSKVPLVDHTALEHLHRFQTESKEAGRSVILSFSDEHRAISRHSLSAKRRPRSA